MVKTIEEAKEMHTNIETEQADGQSLFSARSIFNENSLTEENLDSNQHLIYGYTYEEKGLHIRRTLAQSYYPMLPEQNTEKIDGNQVLMHNDTLDGHQPFVMVDQLWMYILGGPF
jgi:hypothetical protein